MQAEMGNLSQEVLSRIDKLADKLGTTAQHLWEVLTRQGPINSMAVLSAILFCFILGIFFISISWNKPKITDCEVPTPWLFTIALGTILFCGALVGMAVTVTDIWTGFCNPEFYAYQQVKELFH